MLRVARWKKVHKFLVEAKREVAERDGWKKSELVLAIGDCEVLAKRWARKFANWTDEQVDEFLKEARALALKPTPRQGGK